MADSTILGIRELVDYIKNLPSGVHRAVSKAQIAMLQKAEALAKVNAKKQFTGRHGRILTGGLLNNIFTGFEKGDLYPIGFIGVRSIPYGAIHEFGSEGLPGGVIKPVKAKKLWIPQYKTTGRMTPREFIKLKMQNPRMFFLNDKVAGKWENPKSKVKRLIPMFYLVDKVRIPARPYLVPAIEASIEFFPGYLDKFIEEENK